MVYIDDIESIINQVKDELTNRYGDRVQFGTTNEEVYKINL